MDTAMTEEVIDLKGICYYVLQWTWGILQNLMGAAVYLAQFGQPRFRCRCARAVRWNRSASMGLGMFIFVGRDAVFGPDGENIIKRILYHEYGHTIQSAILGPLYLPVIAIPSLIWANSPGLSRYRVRSGRSYYSFYPERWADQLGLRYIQTDNRGKRK